MWVTAENLPNKELLTSDKILTDCDALKPLFFNYPGDDTNFLDGLVLAREGFEEEDPYRMRVCSTCLDDMRKNKLPKAAKANGFVLGDFPEELQAASWVEMIAASPVRMSGTVLALEQFKIGQVPGSAKSMMRGTFTFYLQNSYAIGQHLPACATDVAGSFTCALVGSKPTPEQLRRFFGARRSMVRALLDFQLDRSDRLAGVHKLARDAQTSEDNLRTYAEDGSIPKAIQEALFPVTDRANSIANARSTHAHGNREPETTGSNGGDEMVDSLEPVGVKGNGMDTIEDSTTAPFIIETNAVMPSGGDMANVIHYRGTRLRTLRSMMKRSSLVTTTEDNASASLARQANAEAAAAVGRAPPVLTENAMVVTHTGNLVSDFYDNGLFVGAYFNLFPHGLGGHLDVRRRSISFKEWAQILLRQRDARFRKDRTFLFCVCALIFRREAINNARWKITRGVPKSVAQQLVSVTPEDLGAAAKEIEQGTGAWSTLNDRPAIRALITSMESVHAGASWTTYNKRSTRMKGISFTMQMGQPFFWMTVSPSDTNSPIVLEMAGFKIDVTSRLKADYPDYPERLRLVAGNHVASAFFYHSVIEAVLTCLLRFGAADGDGGVLGRVKGYIGMTEEQRRLMLHCHLLVWVYGYNDFSSFRALLDKTPKKYNKLARFLEQVIFNQVATLADVNLTLHGHGYNDVTASSRDSAASRPTPDPLVVNAKERIAQPPPTACFPRDGIDRCHVHDIAFARLMYLDLAELTPGANLHKCQPTCHKYNHKDSCR